MKDNRLLGLLLACALVASPVTARAQEAPLPNKAKSVTSKRGVVATDQPQTSRIAARVLAEGGNAADAGAAALLVNGVLNPFASGLGGGGFCLYRPQKTGEVHVIDFREKAPKKATRDMFVVDGHPETMLQLRGGTAVGVPGEPAGLWVLQKQFGKLKWKQVVDPAVGVATHYKAGALLAERLQQTADKLTEHPRLAMLFKVDGHWATKGDKLSRPALAKTLAMYRDKGPIIFYQGDVGQAIVDEVDAAGGVFTPADLHAYSVAHRKPIEGTYRGYTIFSMPPPSSGGTTLVETLNILEGLHFGKNGVDPESIHLISESLKHAFADRARWLGDTDFVDVPIDRLISKDYATKLRKTIKPHGVLPVDAYGTHRQLPEDHGTTHVSIIDGQGNMLACTSTINTSFGSMVYVDKYGIILNNEMGDFTPMPGKPNNYGLIGTGQNAVAPEKRPLSSMSPTLVLQDGQPFMAGGASGGPTIITGTLLALVNLIDFNMTPAEAIAAPRIHDQWRPQILFVEPELGGKDQLRKWGHKLVVKRAFNSVQIVVRNADGTLTGVSDPRKMGRPAAEPAPNAQPSTRDRK